jgi:hypothetical protein
VTDLLIRDCLYEAVDNLDLRECQLALRYPRNDGYLTYRSPGQTQRPHTRTPGARRMAMERAAPVKP